MDYIQHKCLLNMGTADLYGSNDPFQRMPRSPKVLASDPNVDDLIVKVDLGNYSQLTPGGEEGAAGEDTAGAAAVSRVKSPATKSLSNKAGTGKLFHSFCFTDKQNFIINTFILFCLA